MRKVETLAAKLAPLTLELERVVDAGSTFHQCVYILIKKTPDLMGAEEAARDAIGIDSTTLSTYMPHLSLIYSDVEQETRQRIASEIQVRLFSESGLPELTAYVDSIEVWYTPAEDKSLKEWEMLGRYPLSGENPRMTDNCLEQR